MSDTFCFLVADGHLTRQQAQQADRIARRHGAGLTEAQEPGQEPKRWFTGPRLAPPFDQRLYNAVRDDLERAGIPTGSTTTQRKPR